MAALAAALQMGRTLAAHQRRIALLGPRCASALFGRAVSTASSSSTAATGAPAAPPAPPHRRKDDESLDPRVWPITGSNLLTGTAIGVVAPLLPIFARSLGLTPSDFGLVISAVGITRLLANVPATWASDRFGRKRILVGGAIVSSVGMVGTALATGFSELLLWRFAMGAGSAANMAGTAVTICTLCCRP